MTVAAKSRMRLQASLAAAGSAVLWWRLGGWAWSVILVLFAVLAVAAWAFPRHYQPVQRVFDFLTRMLVSGVSWALLALLYFAVFMPLRFLFQAGGKDFMRRRPAPEEKTNLLPLSAAAADHFKRQY